MSARKFTAALFENVDYKAQAAEMAKKDAAKQREKDERQNRKNCEKPGVFDRLFSRSSSSISPPKEPTTSSLTWPRVFLFGDSLTQYAFGSEGGWAAMLADKLQRKADVVNRGFSGYNTRW